MDLKTERRKQGITQVELAKRVGTSQSSITRYETGLINPKPAMANKIAAEIGIDWTEFYNEEESNGNNRTDDEN